MIRLTHNLAIGGMEHCSSEQAIMSVVHACRTPCFCRAAELTSPTKSSLALENPPRLYLDLTDAPAPEHVDGVAVRAALEWCRVQLFEERKVLIHCDGGRSRACALAIAVMAKVTGDLPDASFDEAWDGFAALMMAREEPLLDWFQPSNGIEEWFRENWSEMGRGIERLDPHHPQTQKGGGGGAVEKPPMSNSEIMATIMVDPAWHFSTCTQIKGKDGKLEFPYPNAVQTQMFEAYSWLQPQGLAINLIVLKARQCGGSEGTAELCYHHGRRFNLGGLMMADQDKRTNKIWELFCRKAETDSFNQHWGNRFSANREQATITFADQCGRNQKAVWERDTAMDPKAGASGTRQIIWFSESARYAKDGKFRDSVVIANALNSIPPDEPNTMRIAESTAEGSGGWHHDTFEGAVYLSERIMGKVGNGWIKIFVGWHQCEDYRLRENLVNREYFDDQDARWTTFREDEEAGRLRYGWTREQIAWRRKKISSDLSGDVGLFRRDFPSSPREAWASSGSKRFNVVAIAKMLLAAETLWNATMRGEPTAPQLGSLVDGATGATFLPMRDDAWLWVKEIPEYGRHYSITVDPMTGEQAAGSDVPDNHAVGVRRNAYVDERGVFQPAEIVAVIYVPGGCRWDIDVLAERVHLLSRWYGRCIVIPEVNKAMDLIPYLRELGTPLYMRKAKPDTLNPSEHQQIVGFYSSEATRRMWVSAAAQHIRESETICLFLPAVREFDVFVTTSGGRSQAAAGEHDDFVAMFGISCLCEKAATVMQLPRAPVNRSAQQHTLTAKGYAAVG